MEITCYDITYREYVSIIVSKFEKVSKLSGLSKEELVDLRAKLAIEFQSLAGDKSQSSYRQLYDSYKKKLNRLNRLSLLALYLEVFSIEHEVIKEAFEALRIKVRKGETQEGVIERLEFSMVKLKSECNTLEKAILKMHEKNKDGGDIAEADLYKVIASISAGLSFSISLDDNAAVVAGYIEILNKQQERNGK